MPSITEGALTFQFPDGWLHLEQPVKPSKLFPRAIDPAKVTQKLKQLLKAIDPRPKVVDIGRPGGVAWSVT